MLKVQVEKMTLILPNYIKQLLLLLEQAGYEAYAVGGAVRDLLLGLEPEDYDVTTNARPEQILAVAKKAGYGAVEHLGENFGVVVLLIQGHPVETAAFRGERYGSDPHRPASVWYCERLEEDLSRRDFTINAMALDVRGKLYDPFQGQMDLQRHVLRTVGLASQRFQEDALRMYRACRLAAQLDFTYEGTLPFVIEGCRQLSAERVRRELDKLLVSKASGRGLRLLMESHLLQAYCRQRQDGLDHYEPVLPELRHLYQLPQNAKFHCYDAWEHTVHAVDNSPRDLTIRWALLLHDVAKGLPGVRQLNKEGQPSDHGHEAVSAKMAGPILQRLGYSETFTQRVVWLVAQHMRFAPLLVRRQRTILHWVRGEACKGIFRREADLAEAYTQLVAVFLADMGATWAGRDNPQLMEEGRLLGKMVIELARDKMPVATGDLQVGGKDLLQMVEPEDKKEIGRLLHYLLARVQNGGLPNEKMALLEAVRKKQQRQERKVGDPQ